ncbi:DUF397 domain-containing protein [Streptomyces sp. NPDC052236]|uniref:DUF397 domain-containing protein n=1 Tax=Streptomyces sp. NPDC052236 TaxID=3365686 RepID=UPI0037D11D7E
MSHLTWQKSSYSTGGQGECTELASGPTGLVHLRESDRPTQIATATPAALAALLDSVKSCGGGTWAP